MPVDNRTMIASPVAALLKSRKFIALITALLVNIIIALVPAFEPIQEHLITVVSALFVALIGGIAFEDAHKPAPGTTSTSVTVDAQSVTTPPAAPNGTGNG